MNRIYIECSTETCFVGIIVSNGNKTVTTFKNKTVLEKLNVYVKQLLDEYNLTLNQIDEIYISEGIGFNTGLRLSMTLVKTLVLLNPNLKVNLVNLFKEATLLTNKTPCVLDRHNNYLSLKFNEDNSFSFKKFLKEEINDNLIVIGLNLDLLEYLQTTDLMFNAKKYKTLTKDTIGLLKPIYFEM